MSEPARTLAVPLRGAARTDPGRLRTNNEDLPLIDPARGIFGVIDGVGGEAGGEVAAATAQDVILQRLARPVGAPAERVREAIALANNEIFRRAQESVALRGMACVVTLAVVADGRLTVGHVGDARLYTIRADGLRKVTRDHSPVGEREDAGELGEVDAMRHPRRNEVFRDVGSSYRDKDEDGFVDIVEEPLERDSAILVCSDGLSDMLTGSTILHIVRQHAGDPPRVVDALVAAANDAGGKDNVTAVYAEGALFPAAVGGARIDTQTPTEPLGGVAAPQLPAAAAGGGAIRRAVRSIMASRATWLIMGVLLGVVGALALTLYVARTQTPASRTLVVSSAAGSPYASISLAMAAAQPGDVVRVEPGEYGEQVVIADGVDLVARMPGTVTIVRPPGLDPAVPTVLAAGLQMVRMSGLRVTAAAGRPVGTGVRVVSAAVLDLVDVNGPFAQGIAVLPGGSVTMHGSRVAVAGAVVSVPDGAQASLSNNIFVRGGASPDAAIEAGALSRLTLSGNVFSGFPAEIVRGVGEARRRELLSGNTVVTPPAPRRAPARLR